MNSDVTPTLPLTNRKPQTPLLQEFTPELQLSREQLCSISYEGMLLYFGEHEILAEMKHERREMTCRLVKVGYEEDSWD